MKEIILAFCFSFSVLVSFAQTDVGIGNLLMPKEQNHDWLTSIKPKTMDLQWTMIKERYFDIKGNHKEDTEEKCCYPTLIIDGIGIQLSDALSTDIITRLANLLTIDKIKDIAVLDKEPEGLYVEKEFAGIIVVALNDKRTRKKLIKIKLK